MGGRFSSEANKSVWPSWNQSGEICVAAFVLTMFAFCFACVDRPRDEKSNGLLKHKAGGVHKNMYLEWIGNIFPRKD